MSNIFGQQTNFSCPMGGSSDNFASPLHLIDADFFSKKACGTPLYLNCNFVFLTRNDGSGAFPQDDPLTDLIIGEILKKMNQRWASIRDHNSCEPNEGYPFDSNIRAKLLGTHYIANTQAWDYFAQATSLPNYNYLDFCPRQLVEDGTWPALETIVNEFNGEHPNAFNFFFVENGAHIENLENLIQNGLEPSGPWDDGINTFSGCSRIAANYHSNNAQFLIMENFYTNWLARINFGSIYYPEFADDGNATIAQWHLNAMPIVVNHELGHSIMNQFHTNDGCDNLMGTPNSASKRYLSINQLNRLHRTLMTTNNHKYVSCDDLSSTTCNLVITHDATIDDPMSIFGDIVVEDEVTLTITSEVYLSKESSIDLGYKAKLIVDGGLLTSDCGETWKGIKVTGGNNDFDVEFKNDAIIENTSKAAVSMFPPLPWLEMTNYGNGILHAENTTFNNTARIVEFIAFQPSINTSYIRQCTQNGGTYGITNWNCQFIEVTDNIFNDIKSECIVTIAGSFRIEENTFYSEKNDIFFANVSAGIGSIIQNNKFHSANTGIRAMGTTFGLNEITGNEFFAGTFDIWMEGDNFYEITGNDMSSPFIGVVSANNGNQQNEVSLNAFKNNFAGIVPSGTNPAYLFNQNCFNTTFADAFITGEVSGFMASDLGSSNNCFTHGGDINSTIADIAGSPDPFTYVEPADAVIDCIDAVLAHENVTIFEVSGEAVDACEMAGADIVTPPDDEYKPCAPERNIISCLDAKLWLENERTQIELENPTSPVGIHLMSQQGGLTNLLEENESCLKKVNRMLFELYLIDDRYTDARDLFANDATDDAKVAIFSSYCYEHDLDTALEYLENESNPTEQLEDFKEVQYIYLERLKKGPAFVANNIALEKLNSIATKNHPYSAYAKSLIYVLTKEILSSDLPIMKEETKALISNPIVHQPSIVKSTKVFPNPFGNKLDITTIGYDQFKIEIVDFTGRIIYSATQDTSDETINTSNWQNGIYIITIDSDNVTILQQKIVLIH